MQFSDRASVHCGFQMTVVRQTGHQWIRSGHIIPSVWELEGADISSYHWGAGCRSEEQKSVRLAAAGGPEQRERLHGWRSPGRKSRWTLDKLR